jgi:hypothetical protein
MNQHWITPDSDRPLDRATVLKSFVVPQTPDVPASIPFAADVSLRPEMRRGCQNPPFDVTPANFEFGRGRCGRRSGFHDLLAFMPCSRLPELADT